MTDVTHAAGGIVWRDAGDGGEVAVIYRPDYGDWTLPKGHLNQGESWQDAAIREIREEIGCEVRVGDFAGCLCYLVNHVPKIVLFWQMFVVKEHPSQSSIEQIQVLWLPINAAIERLDYPAEKKLLSKALIPVEIAYSRRAD